MASSSTILNDEQLHALEAVKNEKTIFLTGAGGVGKSTTLQEIIKWAKSNNKNIGITATTGAAAILIGGMTIHSYLGIGIGAKNAQDLANMVFIKNKKTLHRLRNLDILIIDEVSMLDNIFFEKLSDFLSIIRMNTDAPFGGLQMVLTGDFCQNAPIENTYCFKSPLWKKMNITNIFLKKLMRQANDMEFQEILEAIRFGKITPTILKKLEELKHTKVPEDMEPTILYGRNKDVDLYNNKNYKKLIEAGMESRTYVTEGSTNWVKSCKIAESVELCIGAQVMLTWNVSCEGGLVNGSRGKVVGFSPTGPIVYFYGLKKEVAIEHVIVINEDDKTMQIIFMPIRLGYSISIHKSQGSTIDFAVVDLNCFASGQAYVAISRVRSLKDLKIIGNIRKEYFLTDKDVIAFYSQEQ